MAPKVQLTLNLDATHTPTTTLTEAAKRKKSEYRNARRSLATPCLVEK